METKLTDRKQPSNRQMAAHVRRLLSPSTRRAIRAAEVLFASKESKPTPERLALIAEAAGAKPGPVRARFGFLPSAIRGYRRGVWAVCHLRTSRAFVPSDREIALALVLYQLAGGSIRCELIKS